MQTTGNLGLKKPEGTDVVDIADLNGNADIIDTAVASKVDKEAGKGLSANDYTTAEKTKLAGVAAGANAYVHPSTHPASIIVQDASNRFTTDAEKAAWTAKASTAASTTTTAGLQSAADKAKLDGIAAGATNYTHPSTHPASIIVQDASNRFVTDTEKTSWNAKATTVSPAFTGTPVAPTAAVGTNTTQIATTAYVKANLACKKMVDGTNINTLITTDHYYVFNGINSPTANIGFYYDVVSHPDISGYVMQVAYLVDNNKVYTRRLNNNVWSSWAQMNNSHFGEMASDLFFHSATSPYTTGLKFWGDGTGWRFPFKKADGTIVATIRDDGEIFAGMGNYQVSHSGRSVIESRSGSDPVSPVVGQMWLRTDL